MDPKVSRLTSSPEDEAARLKQLLAEVTASGPTSKQRSWDSSSRTKLRMPANITPSTDRGDGGSLADRTSLRSAVVTSDRLEGISRGVAQVTQSSLYRSSASSTTSRFLDYTQNSDSKPPDTPDSDKAVLELSPSLSSRADELTENIRSNIGRSKSTGRLGRSSASIPAIAGSMGGNDSPVRGILNILDNMGMQASEQKDSDEMDAEDMTTIHFGTKILFRGYQGQYLATQETEPEASNKDAPPFVLTPTGMGVGDWTEVFTLYDATFRDNRGPVRYGDTVVVRGAGAKERCLAYHDAPRRRLGLWRNMYAHSEKWLVLKATRTDNQGTITGNDSQVQSKAVGTYLRAGDEIFLKAYSGGQLLSLTETEQGPTVSCSEPEGFPEECETWQVILSGSPSYPVWNNARFFLSGEFLVHQERGEASRSDCLLFGVGRQPQTNKQKRLTIFPPQVQEQLLLEDLLSVLMGFEGRYIKINVATKGLKSGRSTPATPVQGGASTPRFPTSPDQVRFALALGMCNKSLTYAVTRLLPLAHYYVRATHFCREKSRYEYGLVSHAFAAAIRTLLKEYLLLIAQLEHQFLQGNLTLQRLWFFTQPSLQTMEVIDQLIESVGQLSGGRLLNVLQDALRTSGDEKLRKIHEWLLHRASVPYLDMLARWIYRGELDDPYEEFMVQEDPSMRNKEMILQDFNAQYWDLKYTVRKECVMSFLSQHADKILTTGKYFNVIRECQREVNCPFARPMTYALGEARYGELVDEAFNYASEKLLDLVLREQQLIARLQSMKHYFFLDQGDFFVHFMDIAEEDLQFDVAQISHTRLETLLLLAIQSSSVAEDPYRDNVLCEFADKNLIHHLNAIHNAAESIGVGGEQSGVSGHLQYGASHLKGIEAFMLSYKVTWPLSIVVSKKALTKYQLLFRHLFFSKHVERKLLDTWLDHQVTKELDLRSAMGPTYGLRQRMLHFMQNFVYYMMFEVLEPRWHDLKGKISSVKNVDEILKYHGEFLDTCLKECLLSNQELLKILTKLMTTCLLFSDKMRSFTRTNQIGEDAMRNAAQEAIEARQSTNRRKKETAKPWYQETALVCKIRKERIKVQSDQMRSELSDQSYKAMLRRFQDQFDAHLQQFLEMLMKSSNAQYHSHLSNLCTRLDYNGFFTETMQDGY